MSVWPTVLLGLCLVGLVTIGLFYLKAAVQPGYSSFRLLSVRVTVRSGYCLLGKFPSGYCLSGMCPRGSVHRANVWLGYCLDTKFHLKVPMQRQNYKNQIDIADLKSFSNQRFDFLFIIIIVIIIIINFFQVQ